YHLAKKDNEDTEDQVDENKTGVFAIAGVTIANGGDNLGVYIPLLATYNYQQKIVFVLIFLVLVFVWCELARFLASRPIVAKTLSTYGHFIMPVVLLLLGVFILIESDSFSLLR
ncbi:MAG TPA: cadmium resistance transporter, partial [Cyclobacteriaceae bacterium]|nr:cadmium resistance transporter [Cyclobacteriaceae bacterium]